MDRVSFSPVSWSSIEKLNGSKMENLMRRENQGSITTRGFLWERGLDRIVAHLDVAGSEGWNQ